MPRLDIFKPVFEELAEDGFIGDPGGQSAYAYIRVSSDEQAEEGRSGLPRQIEHIHEIAREKNLKIAWDLVFADDYTGFEFEARPALQRLRKEYTSPGRQASTIVMEHLDRLSRNSDWHQGYLLDEMKRHEVNAVFWKPFHSRIERVVMGAVAQDAMELALARMYEGKRAKARNGQVTSRTRSYGYKFVDSNGHEGPKSRKDTHYAIHESEAQVIRRIYTEVANGKPLHAIARDLTGVFPTPKGKVNWGKSTITALVRSSNYKGEFHAFRWSKDREGHNIENENYIIVPIPPLVSADLWQLANDMLAKNRLMAQRRAPQPYLLTGLIKCASCGRTYIGHSDQKRYGRQGQELRKNPQRTYGCNSRSDYRRKELRCAQGKIGCAKLDTAVWSSICMVLLNPSVLINALEQQYENSGNSILFEQIAFLEQEIEAKKGDDAKLYKAYMVGAFDEHEFAEQRRYLKETSQKLRTEIEQVRSRVLSRKEVEKRKQFLLEIAEQLRKTGNFAEAPFELKQQIIKLIVDKIVLNTSEEWFRLEGAISGTYLLGVTTPDDCPDSDGTHQRTKLQSTADFTQENVSFVTKNTPIPAPVGG